MCQKYNKRKQHVKKGRNKRKHKGTKIKQTGTKSNNMKQKYNKWKQEGTKVNNR